MTRPSPPCRISPSLAAARDWLRTAAAEGAADVDVRDVVEYIRPGHLGTAEPSAR